MVNLHQTHVIFMCTALSILWFKLAFANSKHIRNCLTRFRGRLESYSLRFQTIQPRISEIGIFNQQRTNEGQCNNNTKQRKENSLQTTSISRSNVQMNSDLGESTSRTWARKCTMRMWVRKCTMQTWARDYGANVSERDDHEYVTIY